MIHINTDRHHYGQYRDRQGYGRAAQDLQPCSTVSKLEQAFVGYRAQIHNHLFRTSVTSNFVSMGGNEYCIAFQTGTTSNVPLGKRDVL